jgi:hypothetical protein
MTEITNPKIERIKAEILKTKARISEMQSKLRSQERQKIGYENEEIIAMVRDEHFSDELLALLRANRIKLETSEQEQKEAENDTVQN